MANPLQINLSESPRRKSLAETVAQQLMKALEGLPAGTRLPSEQELMAQMRVGRSAVREALSGLALLGAIEIRQGQGVFATGKLASIAAHEEIRTALDKGVTRDLLEVRRLIEVEVVRLASERRTDDDIAAMRRVLATHARQLEEGERPDEPGGSFHLVLADASHNEVLASMVSSFFKLMIDRVPVIYALDGFAAWELEQHTALVDAIEARDVELAVARMTTHLADMADHYRRSGTA